MISITKCLCALAASTLCLAAPLSAESDAGQTLTWDATIDAPVEKVWDYFVTEEGREAWMAPASSVDLRLGGAVISAYEGEATLDNPKSIVQRILAYEPMRMIAMRVERAPEGFPFAEAVTNSWGVITFDEIWPGRTHVRLSSVGWQEGGVWDEAKKFFEAGNAYLLDELKKVASSEQPAASDGDALEALQWMVGGEWTHESTRPDGSTFRVRSVVEHAPDGESLVSKAWLGDADGMFLHGDTQIWREPASGEVRFQNINERGALSRGVMTTTGPETVVWDWHLTEPDGTSARFRVVTKREGEDAYRFTLKRYMPDDSLSEMVNIVYERVAEAPAEFKKGLAN